jgi:tRNA (guanosine-2'-O-)-methyltransferase
MMAGGCRRWVDVAVHPDLQGAIHSLRADGWRLLAAHPGEGARDYRQIDYTQKVAIVLGSELDGLTVAAVDASDERIAVPMEGMVASLNVSVAAALILYEAQRQRRAAGLYARSRIEEEEYRTTLFEWAYPEIAERCRVRGRAYPDLAEDGSLESNPLDDADETTTVDS